MKKVGCFTLYGFLILFGCTLSSFSGFPEEKLAVEITHLRCEYLSDPLGIDQLHPRLSWELYAAERGMKQKAFQILVASDSQTLARNVGDLWDTGKRYSDSTNQIAYQGKKLETGTTCYWKVRIWDEQNRASAWSRQGYWSMGLLHDGDWHAQWIGAPPIASPVDQDRHTIPPSPLLRKEFKLSGKKVKKATLYATALGVYELYLNGARVGDQYLAPEWTDYDKRVQYQTYDVTRLLTPAGNVIGAMLADGWYAGVLFTHQQPTRGNYGFNRRLLAQLTIEYEDGSVSTVGTDQSWKILENGPVHAASIFDGEVYDARLNPAHWLTTGFNDDCWDPVAVDSTVTIALNAQMNEPIRIVREIKPVSVFKVKGNTYILDLGQNIAGWISLDLPYNPGRTITLRHGEMLNEDSTLYMDNLRSAKQTDVYIPAKGPVLHYEPRFTYHGFRYVEISGLSKAPTLDQVMGKVLSSSSPVVSQMQTSNPALNKLWENILWTQLDNMHSVPTDCPQRDERCGWMGDAQVFCQTAMYNMDMAAFFSKWFRDIRDEQTPEGRFPNYAPQVGMAFYDAPAWSDAGVIIPWKHYLNYGDTSTLQAQYPAMCKFIDYVFSQNPNLIWTKAVGNNYGDWLNGNTIRSADYPREHGAVPKDVFSTAFFAYSTSLVAKASRVLGHQTEFRHYDSLARAIKEVFKDQFIGNDGTIKGNTQAGYALALEFDLVPPSLKAAAAKRMKDGVTAYDNRISTGIQSTIRMMNQLSSFGYQEVAYQLLESHRFPSWIYSIDQGATTIWERWDGFVKGRGFQGVGMNSFNHYAIGSVGEWLYAHMLGINYDENNPGYRHILIKPQPGGDLRWAKGSYHSIVGEIGVGWERKAGSTVYQIDIPANTSATVILPGGKRILEGGNTIKQASGMGKVESRGGNYIMAVGSGKYSFEVFL